MIKPPAELLAPRYCYAEPQTYRQAADALIDCRNNNAKQNADKRALREFYKGLE